MGEIVIFPIDFHYKHQNHKNSKIFLIWTATNAKFAMDLLFPPSWTNIRNDSQFFAESVKRGMAL